jgi:uncharacterized membrane protein
MIKRKTGGVQIALGFVKTTVIGGLVFLVPLLILVLLVTKAAGLLQRLAQPLAAHLEVDTVFGILAADIIAVVLVILACFIAGLIARVTVINHFIRRAEAGVLWRIPGYGFIKGLTDSLDNSAAKSSMRPVLIHFDDAAQLAFEVDQVEDGRRVIYVPSAPDPRAGEVLVMEPDRVEAVPITFLAAFSAQRALGRGIGASLSSTGK